MEAQQCVKLSLTNRSIGLIPSSLSIATRLSCSGKTPARDDKQKIKGGLCKDEPQQGAQEGARKAHFKKHPLISAPFNIGPL